jgi:Tfp pilus assembly protein PilV
MTLVEVLAAICVLGGGATAILVAQARAIERLQTADLEIEASQIAHELIAQWRLAGLKGSETASGRIEGQRPWSWKRWSESKELAPELTVEHITLELSRELDERGATWARTFSWFEKSNGKQAS